VTGAISARAVRASLVARRELALVDLRDEAQFATGHPLFAADLPVPRVEIEAPTRIPRRDTLVVLYDDAGREGAAAIALERLGYSQVRILDGGLAAWVREGYELFRDVNSYSKAFGELVEARRQTPSIGPEELSGLIDSGADIALVDVRRPDEYRTMSIRTSRNVPGGELVLRARSLAPRSETLVVVHCAGRTRSIIGTQSLVNAGIPNRVTALRNGTIGWVLAHQTLAGGTAPPVALPSADAVAEARGRAREVAYRAGVLRLDATEFETLSNDSTRTLYTFDVRSAEEYAVGHLPGFRHAPGGQLVQEIDSFAPVRGARIVLTDTLGARADMTASWLAQMGWDAYVLEGEIAGSLETDVPPSLPPRAIQGRYRRPYEGTDQAEAAMRGYLDWEHGLVAQLARDRTHGFFVI